MKENPLEFLYEGLEHGKETLLKSIPKTNEDGQDVDVFVTVFPARFYTIKVKSNNKKSSFVLSTGSGMKTLALEIAEAIADGMIVLKNE